MMVGGLCMIEFLGYSKERCKIPSSVKRIWISYGGDVEWLVDELFMMTKASKESLTLYEYKRNCDKFVLLLTKHRYLVK